VSCCCCCCCCCTNWCAVLLLLQVGGRALGEVCNAFPERLLRCLVLVSTGQPTQYIIVNQLSQSSR
jgi:hypothetical protein